MNSLSKLLVMLIIITLIVIVVLLSKVNKSKKEVRTVAFYEVRDMEQNKQKSDSLVVPTKEYLMPGVESIPVQSPVQVQQPAQKQ